MTLCFLAAFEAKQRGEISEDEYIRHLLAHCTGVRHDNEDWFKDAALDIRDADPFGHSVRSWALTMDTIDGTGSQVLLMTSADDF